MGELLSRRSSPQSMCTSQMKQYVDCTTAAAMKRWSWCGEGASFRT